MRWSVPFALGEFLVEGPLLAEAVWRFYTASAGWRLLRQSIVVFVQDALLSRVILENWGADPRSVEIVPQFLVRDPVIEAVVTQLAIEAGNDSPSGLLYGEGVTASAQCTPGQLTQYRVQKSDGELFWAQRGELKTL